MIALSAYDVAYDDFSDDVIACGSVVGSATLTLRDWDSAEDAAAVIEEEVDVDTLTAAAQTALANFSTQINCSACSGSVTALSVVDSDSSAAAAGGPDLLLVLALLVPAVAVVLVVAVCLVFRHRRTRRFPPPVPPHALATRTPHADFELALGSSSSVESSESAESGSTLEASACRSGVSFEYRSHLTESSDYHN